MNFLGLYLSGSRLDTSQPSYRNKLQYRGSGKYRRGLNDCRNCKNMVCISWDGWIKCERYGSKLSGKPQCCAMYERTVDIGKGS